MQTNRLTKVCRKLRPYRRQSGPTALRQTLFGHGPAPTKTAAPAAKAAKGGTYGSPTAEAKHTTPTARPHGRAEDELQPATRGTRSTP